MKKYYPIVLAVISAALFGISTPVSKTILSELNPFLLAGLLYLGAGLGLALFTILKGKHFQFNNLNKKYLFNIAGMIIFGGLLGPVFLLLGLKMASSGSVSLWLNMELVATAILGFLFFKEHLGRMGWLGAAGSFLAGALLSINEQSTGLLPGIFIFIACFCWGLDNHFTALIDGITPTESTILKGIIAGTVNLVIGFFISGGMNFNYSVLYALIIGLFSYGISIVLYITSAQNMGAIRSQIFFSSAPFWGLFFSFLLLKETVSFLQILSAGIFILSVAVILFEKHSHHHHHHSTEHMHLHRHDDLHHGHTHLKDGIIPSHTHKHTHEYLEHNHPHLPDLHHRHDHN